MRKSKSPEIVNDPSGPGCQGPAARGLAAYQHTMAQKKSAKDTISMGSPKQGTVGTTYSEEGLQFIKTDKLPKPQEINFKKTLPIESQTGSLEEEQESKYRKVAKLLILIGADEAAQILSRLDPEQIEAVSREIAAIRGITPDEATSILAEFRSLLAASYKYSGAVAGGLETARDILHTAFGHEKGEAILSKTVPKLTKNLFNFLENISGEQLVFLFKDESLAVEALVLSRLPPKLAADVLAHSQPCRKIELIRRIAHLDKTSPEVLEQVSLTLQEKVKYLGDTAAMAETTGVDGLNALTAILKSSNSSFGDQILEELGNEDPYLQADLKERLNTLDDLVKVEDRPIQDKLYTMSDLDIVLLLKNRSKEFVEKILSNMTVERRAYIREEAEILGPMRKKDVDRAARRFLDWFRENREAGRIILIDDEDILV